MNINDAYNVIKEYNARYNTHFDFPLRIDLYSQTDCDWHNIGTPGVYIITSEDENVLFIGRADALGPRLWEYFRSEDAFCDPSSNWLTKPKLAYAFKSFEDAHWELYSLESYLIEKINPEENVRAGIGALGAKFTPLEDRIGDELTRKFSKRYEEKMHNLDIDKDFARDDSYHGNFAPRHMMYKLAPLYTRDKSIKYEFLIEYKKGFPVQGIYYGCKGLILDGEQMLKNNTIDKQWQSIKKDVTEVLEDTFPGKRFLARFKETDNINNKTYWPFWITLGEDENILEVAGRATKMIRKIYKELLKLEDDNSYPAPISPTSDSYKPCDNYRRNECDAETSTAFTEVAMEKILNSFSRDQDRECFTRFLNNAEHYIARNYGKKKPILTRSPLYPCAWYINIKNIDFAALLYALFWEKKGDRAVKRINYKFLHNKKVPWEDMESIFRDSNDKKFKNRSLSNSWSKDKENKPKRNGRPLEKTNLQFAQEEILKILNYKPCDDS